MNVVAGQRMRGRDARRDRSRDNTDCRYSEASVSSSCFVWHIYPTVSGAKRLEGNSHQSERVAQGIVRRWLRLLVGGGQPVKRVGLGLMPSIVSVDHHAAAQRRFERVRGEGAAKWEDSLASREDFIVSGHGRSDCCPLGVSAPCKNWPLERSQLSVVANTVRLFSFTSCHYIDYQ